MKEDIGSQIPGSRYVRAYCHFCEEPIRVTRALNSDGDPIYHVCDSCSEKTSDNKKGQVGPDDLDGFQIF